MAFVTHGNLSTPAELWAGQQGQVQGTGARPVACRTDLGRAAAIHLQQDGSQSSQADEVGYQLSSGEGESHQTK